MPVKIQIASKKMEGLRHWNQICTFSNPPSQGHSCEREKPRTVALGAEWTGHYCPGCRVDQALLPWVQSGPGTVVLTAERTGHCCRNCRVDRWQSWAVFCVCCDSATLSHATRLYLRFLSHPFEGTIVMKSLWLDCHLWLDLSPLPLGIWDGWG